MPKNLVLLCFLSLVLSTPCLAQTSSQPTPLKGAIIGLVHGSVEGFLQQSLHRQGIQLVGIAESNQQLAADYAKKFDIDPKLLFTSIDDMLERTHPQAALVYSNTRDHRQAVEISARPRAPLMLQTPLAPTIPPTPPP